MKVIDLLVKIANGEEIPYRIKYNERIYEYAEEIKWYLRDDLKNELTNSKKCLNDEVETIEDTPKVQVEMTQKEYNEYLDRKLNTPKEDKRIEKLDLSDWWEITSSEDCKPEMLAKIFNKNAKAFSIKINEIIDKINGE